MNKSKKPDFEQLFQEEDKLPLKKTFFSMVFITFIIALAVGGAFLFNKNRQIRVIAKYTKETRSLIEKKDIEFAQLFDSTIELCRQELAEKKLASNDKYPPKDVICKSAQQKLADIGVDQLKDSSAIAYIKVTGDKYELIEASGKYNEIRDIKNSYSHFSYRYYNNSDKGNLYDFFVMNKSISMWDDYIRFIPFKEVIVPVVLDGDKTVGFIFRGVIEK